MGVLRTSWGARRREVQPGRPGVAAAQAPRRAEAGERGLHALVHAARGTLPARDGGRWTGRPGAPPSSTAGSPCPPGTPAGRPQQPRRGEADREQVAKGALASDDPFRAGDARIVPVGDRGRSSAPARSSASSSSPTCPRARPRRRSRWSSSATGRVVGRAEPAAAGPGCAGPRAVRGQRAREPASGRGATRCAPSCAADRGRAWEHCSFRIAGPRRGGCRAPRLEAPPDRSDTLTPMISTRSCPRRRTLALAASPLLLSRLASSSRSAAAARRAARARRPRTAPPAAQPAATAPGPRQARASRRRSSWSPSTPSWSTGRASRSAA